MIKQFANQLDKIEKLVTTINQKDTEFMGIEEAAVFLRLKKSTLYQFVFRREIPFYKSTKKLLFKKAELIEWVEKDRVLTLKELEQTMKQTIH